MEIKVIKEIKKLIGKTFDEVTQTGRTSIEFRNNGSTEVVMYHEQECCECVLIEDVTGDLEDLVGTPIVVAEERLSCTRVAKCIKCRANYGCEGRRYTWTFYELRTIKGSVTIRWLGESNGYYGEEVQVSNIRNAFHYPTWGPKHRHDHG